MKHNHIEIPLADDQSLIGIDGLLGPVIPIEQTGLVKESGLGGVDILGRMTTQGTPPKSYDGTIGRVDRESHPLCQPGIILPSFTPCDDSSLLRFGQRKKIGIDEIQHGAASADIADLEGFDRTVADPPVIEILLGAAVHIQVFDIPLLDRLQNASGFTVVTAAFGVLE